MSPRINYSVLVCLFRFRGAASRVLYYTICIAPIMFQKLLFSVELHGMELWHNSSKNNVVYGLSTAVCLGRVSECWVWRTSLRLHLTQLYSRLVQFVPFQRSSQPCPAMSERLNRPNCCRLVGCRHNTHHTSSEFCQRKDLVDQVRAYKWERAE